MIAVHKDVAGGFGVQRFAWQLHTEHDTLSWPGATVTNGGHGATYFDDIFMTPDDHGH